MIAARRVSGVRDGGRHLVREGLDQTVVVTVETPEQRTTRERQRVLFDGVAWLYEATRQGYPSEIADFVVAKAAIGPGAAVLEIGCGIIQETLLAMAPVAS